MAILSEEAIRKQTVLRIAEQMAIAARTAPKGKGSDYIEIRILEGEAIGQVAEKMREIAERKGTTPSFARDADNILSGDIVFLIGTRFGSLGLSYCGLCGFKNCGEREKDPEKPCAFNTGDLGIAIGSAVSVAMDNRVDNRIMYTVGMAVKELGLMGEDVRIVYGIPLSARSKNMFFDRK